MAGVQIFDPKKPTCLATDWSKTGIGFWQITLVGSRFTNDAESRYAPVEGEALAVADALNKARYFFLGCENLIVAVDHKPLLKRLGNRGHS